MLQPLQKLERLELTRTRTTDTGVESIAALTNMTGNVLGLMPHPERDAVPGQAPTGRTDGAGLAIFINAVKMVRS